MSTSEDIAGPKAIRSRQERVQKFTIALINSQGQELDIFMKTYSRQTGISLRKLDEYWEVVSAGNRGPIYQEHGIIKVRQPFRKWLHAQPT